MEINKTGVWGEIYAARYLRTKKYKIISANFRTRFGEIDIIASKGEYICFVEVKTRGEGAISRPMEAVDSEKQDKIIATSAQFLKRYDTKLQSRFDVCEVWLDDNLKLSNINYIENAYDG